MLTILISSVVIFLGYLIFENIILNRYLRAVPLRICVTGTRGKSGVVRMLAAVLREDGRRVLAKTTGSLAVFILPDGEEIAVRRRGLTSIIEQKNLLKKAAHLKVDYLVTEIMSIRPENHFIESQKILKPHILVITNVRLDHTDAMGENKDDIAAVFALNIAKKSTVFIPEKEYRPVFREAVKNAAGELICVKEGLPVIVEPGLKKPLFTGNIELVYALCRHLNIKEAHIIKGLKNVKYDPGEFKVWKRTYPETGKTCYFINGFAANDPESTYTLISEINRAFPFTIGKLTGLINLRVDRADRTLQWIDALKNGGFAHFERVYVTGCHAGIMRRKLGKQSVYVLKHKEPGKIMAEILHNPPVGTRIENEWVLFGFGNIRGTGMKIVNYWNKIGEEYGR